MQNKNSNQQVQPRKRDGTLPDEKAKQEANWFGTSHEPQEEYTEHSTEDIPEKAKLDTPEGQMSEGQPTFGKNDHHR